MGTAGSRNFHFGVDIGEALKVPDQTETKSKEQDKNKAEQEPPVPIDSQ